MLSVQCLIVFLIIAETYGFSYQQKMALSVTVRFQISMDSSKDRFSLSKQNLPKIKQQKDIFNLNSFNHSSIFSNVFKLLTFTKNIFGLTRISKLQRFRLFTSVILPSLLLLPRKSLASVVSTAAEKLPGEMTPMQGIAFWATCFIFSAVLHSAESAITKISPFKVQQLADEEGPSSPFTTLSDTTSITRLLSTILLSTTALSIYSTALFVSSASLLLPRVSLGFLTACLTLVTLFFGELIPKAFGVSNSERVARMLVPIIVQLSVPLRPVTDIVTLCSNRILSLFGSKPDSEQNVSEDILRIVVAEAQRSDGIETGERRMIEAVLDMQNREVSKIMTPRIEMIAVSHDTPAAQLLRLAANTKYSRIPVYRGDVDHVVGVVFSKELLEWVEVDGGGGGSRAAVPVPTDSSSPHLKQVSRAHGKDWATLTAADLMSATYFIPQTMSTWKALQDLQRRRVHLAVVVDEYGGTAGLVTLEDLLEQVVGEIYDEDDSEDFQEDEQNISRVVIPVCQPLDGNTDNCTVGSDGEGGAVCDKERVVWQLKGQAELADVCEALEMTLELDAMYDESTVGGLLCAVAGEIPPVGWSVVLQGYLFTATEVDDRRVVSVTAERVVGEGDDGVLSGDNGRFVTSPATSTTANTATSASSSNKNESAVFTSAGNG